MKASSPQADRKGVEMNFLVGLLIQLAFAVLVPLAALCAIAFEILYGVNHVVTTPSTWPFVAGIALAAIGLMALSAWVKTVNRRAARR